MAVVTALANDVGFEVVFARTTGRRLAAAGSQGGRLRDPQHSPGVRSLGSAVRDDHPDRRDAARGVPGPCTFIEPDLAALGAAVPEAADAHGMNPDAVSALLRTLGRPRADVDRRLRASDNGRRGDGAEPTGGERGGRRWRSSDGSSSNRSQWSRERPADEVPVVRNDSQTWACRRRGASACPSSASPRERPARSGDAAASKVPLSDRPRASARGRGPGASRALSRVGRPHRPRITRRIPADVTASVEAGPA